MQSSYEDTLMAFLALFYGNPNNWRPLIGELPIGEPPIGEPPTGDTHPLAMVLISDFIPPYTKSERWQHSKIFTIYLPCYQQDIEKYH